jgi:Xaa-Pro aminopeptidase
MQPSSETSLTAAQLSAPDGAGAYQARRADIDAKQERIAALLKELNCEGILLFEPENFAWLTAGASGRGQIDNAEKPALYLSADQRWILCRNVDTQLIFDEELDGLGFQLKEWPWDRGRDQLITDLSQGRTLASDRSYRSCKHAGEHLKKLRRNLTSYEQACLLTLGRIVVTSLEATGYAITSTATEVDAAGQLSHRLILRGVQPLVLTVAGENRLQNYRSYTCGSVPIGSNVTLAATARKFGLCVSAARTVSFGAPDEKFRQAHNAACKISATYVACSWPDAMSREVLAAGRRVYKLTGYEHEWAQCPPGHVTGRAPMEIKFLTRTEELMQAGWPVVWQAGVGPALSCDTYLLQAEGPQDVTMAQSWPQRKIYVQGAHFLRPDILQR